MVAKLDHYASKNAMDIEGLSENTALVLAEKKDVKSFSDLYRLTAEDLADLEGFKKKKIQNLLTAIEKSKTPALDRFIFAIGIGGVGRVAAKDLASRFLSLENLKKATVEELLALENVGEITAKLIVDFFQDKRNEEELKALQAAGVAPVWSETKKQGVFSGEFVVLTGTLSSYKTMVLIRQKAVWRAKFRQIAPVIHICGCDANARNRIVCDNLRALCGRIYAKRNHNRNSPRRNPTDAAFNSPTALCPPDDDPSSPGQGIPPKADAIPSSRRRHRIWPTEERLRPPSGRAATRQRRRTSG